MVRGVSAKLWREGGSYINRGWFFMRFVWQLVTCEHKLVMNGCAIYYQGVLQRGEKQGFPTPIKNPIWNTDYYHIRTYFWKFLLHCVSSQFGKMDPLPSTTQTVLLLWTGSPKHHSWIELNWIDVTTITGLNRRLSYTRCSPTLTTKQGTITLTYT